MEQNIKNLFKDDNASKKKLPESHRDEFLEKLKMSKFKKQPYYISVYSIAATILLFLAIGYFTIKVIDNSNEIVEESTIALQIKAIEQQYLSNIDKEWQNFLALAKDEKLIKRFEKRLNDLDEDYQDFSQQFYKDTNNILVIEALVENLQIRLQLLKDIQEHIKLLNQQNEQYETTI